MENANNPVVPLEEIKVVAGYGMNQAQEPSEQSDETTSQAEDTAIQNEEKRPEAQVETPKVEEGGDSKHNASTVINELGESRKKVLEKFIESAKKSGVVADELKELISQDKSLEKTFKSKFGDDYDALMRGDLAKPKEALTSEEYTKLKRKATLEAKLEVFKEEDERIKSKQIEVFAQSNALTLDEVEKLKEMTDLLAEKYGFEESLDKALLLVNRDKATTAKTFTPPAGGNAKPQGGEVDNELVQAQKKFMPDRDSKQFSENIESVKQRVQADERGNLTYSVGL